MIINNIVIPLKDTVDSNLSSLLPNALAAIDKALGTIHSCSSTGINEIENNPQRKCLVHCAKGESRSVSVIVAYLLIRHSHTFSSFDEALLHVRTVRPQAMPNVGFALLLRRMAMTPSNH